MYAYINYLHLYLNMYLLYSETELLLLVLKRAAKEFFKEIVVGSDKLLQVAVKLVKSRRAKQSLDVSFPILS